MKKKSQKTKAELDKLVHQIINRRSEALEGKRGKKAQKKVSRKVKKGIIKHTKKMQKKLVIQNKTDALRIARALDTYVSKYG